MGSCCGAMATGCPRNNTSTSHNTREDEAHSMNNEGVRYSIGYEILYCFRVGIVDCERGLRWQALSRSSSRMFLFASIRACLLHGCAIQRPGGDDPLGTTSVASGSATVDI